MKTLEQLAREALEEVHAEWLMDEDDMACQTNAILHVAAAIRAACRAEALEEAAQEFDRRDKGVGGFYDPHEPAEIIRGLIHNAPPSGR